MDAAGPEVTSASISPCSVCDVSKVSAYLQLTPRCRTLAAKLIVIQLVKKFTASSLPFSHSLPIGLYPDLLRSTPQRCTTSLKSILILSSNVRLCFYRYKLTAVCTTYWWSSSVPNFVGSENQGKPNGGRGLRFFRRLELDAV
jgi:hypothetical protein